MSYVSGGQVYHITKAGVEIDITAEIAASLGGAVVYVGSPGDVVVIPRGSLLYFDTVADFPSTGEAGNLYLALDAGTLYYWDGDEYILVSGGGSGGGPENAYAPGGTDVAVADGGTGASTTSQARANLGLTIGQHVQGYSANLTIIGDLATTNTNIIQSVSGVWSSRTPAQVKSTMGLVKADVGLGSVDNTADADKPVSTATQAALDGKQNSDSDLSAIAALSPANNDVIQRKSGAWTNRTPAQLKTDLALVKGDVGLGNVDNTSDANKPVSTATQTALNGKANSSHTHTTADITDFISGNFVLSPTATKTANYSILANEYVPVDTSASGGAVTLTLPNNPADGTLAGVYILNVGQNISLAAAGAGEFFYNGSGTTTVPLYNSSNYVGVSVWRYRSAGDFWYLVSFNALPSSTDIFDASTIGREILTAGSADAIKTALSINAPRVGSTASSATPQPSWDSHDQYNVTALAVNAVLAAPSGTPVDGQPLVYRIKDNGTGRTLGYNAIFRAVGVTAPSATTPNKTIYLGCKYNAADAKVDILAVAEEA